MSRRRTIAALASACFPLLIGCGDEPLSSPVPPHVASESCPLKTPADWQSFIESTVEDDSWVRTCSLDAQCDEGSIG
jgi:hypothetical protein